MDGEWAVSKPSRSDEVLDPDQQVKMAEEIRTHFDSMAPKRPKKPNRSEGPFIDGHDPNSSSPIGNIPEQDKLQALSAQSQVSISPSKKKINNLSCLVFLLTHIYVSFHFCFSTFLLNRAILFPRRNLWRPSTTTS